MIDFRYHIVSIVAIFLALAIGVVLGSGPLQDDIGGFIEDRTAQLAAEKVDLQDEVSTLRSESEAADEYAALVQPNVVNGLLEGESVTLLVLPEASGDSVDAVATAVSESGAGVAEQVQLTSAWVDPDEQEVLARVADGLAQGDIDAGQGASAAEVLAAALVTDNPRLQGQPYSPATAVLSALAETGFVEVQDDIVTRGGSVIVVGSDVIDSETAPAWLDLVSALDADSDAEVVVGPTASAEPGGLISVVRGSDLSAEVSTVDTLESAQGVTTSVLALTDVLDGVVGQYGTGSGADGPAPDPVPAN